MSPYFVFFFPLLFVGLAGVGFTIWMIIDALNRPIQDFNTPGTRMAWLIGLGVGLVTGVFGIVIGTAYWFAVRRPASRS